MVLELIRDVNRALGSTSLLVSHDVKEACHIADLVYVLADGQVIGRGAPQALAASGSERVEQFLNGKPDGPVPFHYPAEPLVEDVLADV